MLPHDIQSQDKSHTSGLLSVHMPKRSVWILFGHYTCTVNTRMSLCTIDTTDKVSCVVAL